MMRAPCVRAIGILPTSVHGNDRRAQGEDMTLAVVPPDPLLDAAVEHRAFVRARLGRLGVPSPDLDDATQDVFEVLARRIDDYDPTLGSSRAYLSGIARRVATKYRRQPDDVPYEDLASDARTDPERAIARAQAWVVLERFLERLDQDRWTVFVLSELEGLSGPEIASELSVNVNTVYARLRSARKDLAREMKTQHARQRGPLGWLLGLFAVPHRVAVAVAGVGAAILLTLLATGSFRGCAGNFEEETKSARVPAGQPPPAPRQRIAAVVPPTQSLDADGEPTAPVRSEDAGVPWTKLGTRTRTTHGVQIVQTGRYRVVGDELTIEADYLADGVVEAFPHHLELEGFSVVHGTDAWSVSLKADEAQRVRVVLRATDVGVTRVALRTGFLDLDTEYDLVTGSTELPFVFDGETLEACGRGACPRVAQLEDEDLSGETILARVRNDCADPLDVALFAGPDDHDPPAEAPRHQLLPGQELSVRVDENAKAYKMDGDRSTLSAGLSSGRVVVFSGNPCNMVSTRKPQR